MASATAPTHASNAELIAWAFGQINRRDVSALRPFWTDDTVERFPDRTCRGEAEIAGYFEEVFAAVPDLHMDVRTISEQGDDVFVHWHLTGTHAGRLFGIAATGKRVAVDGIDHFVVRDGRVVSNFVVFDRMQFAQALGMLPADESRGDRAVKALFNAATALRRRLPT